MPVSFLKSIETFIFAQCSPELDMLSYFQIHVILRLKSRFAVCVDLTVKEYMRQIWMPVVNVWRQVPCLISVHVLCDFRVFLYIQHDALNDIIVKHLLANIVFNQVCTKSDTRILNHVAMLVTVKNPTIHINCVVEFYSIITLDSKKEHIVSSFDVYARFLMQEAVGYGSL